MGVETATLALLASAAGAAGTIYQGIETRRAADAEAEQIQMKAVADKLAHTRQLNKTLAAQRNLFAARGQGGATAVSSLTVTERLGRNQLLAAYHATLANASAVKRGGRTSQTASLFKGGAQLLGGYKEYKGAQ